MRLHHCTQPRDLSGPLPPPARPFPLRLPLLLVALLLVPAAAARAADEQRAEVTKAAVDFSALQPGKPATAAVVIHIGKGYHSQSHDAVKPNIPLVLTPDDNPALKFGEPVYPPGQDHDTKSELGVLNVYEGQVIVRFPVEVKPDAAPGEVKIKGKVKVQVCSDNQCYPPVKLPFEIATSIVPAGQEVKPNEPELFPPAATQPAPSRGGGTGGTPGGESPRVRANGSAQYSSILGAFAFAFLAGLLFNVMPCVLPVLPLKAMGFYEASQHNRGRSLWLGAGFSLGVIASFAVLGLLVVVKQAFKWGEIFSDKRFLGALVVVLVLMALYTFGLFTLRLPSAVYSVSPRHDTFFGNVLFGILTAALSTPCTFGLFVGLLGYALSQPTAIGMSLMVMVGVGMAFPYFILSAFPEAARRFPRTGPWAELVKQFLGFVLLGTAVYFAKPFIARVVSEGAFWWLLFALVVAAAVFVVAKSAQYSKSYAGPAVAALFGVALVLPTYYVIHRLTLRPYAWQPYSTQALAAAQASNRVVVVEFTADWCTTCHALEAQVLNAPDVIETVNKYGVTMMRGDVTESDAPGWAKIRSLGGEGVPLTVVYAPGSADPVQLPGMYGRKDLEAAIAEAAKHQPAAEVARGG